MIAQVIRIAAVLHFACIYAAPTVTINQPQATLVGSSDRGVDSFYNIPFAQPPVGNLRLKPPKPIETDLGQIDATGRPRSCPGRGRFSGSKTGAPEDCLILNVQRPSTAQAGSGLPVLFWIYGGGFLSGSTAKYDATNLINTSVNKEKPIIYVSVNYRLAGFGFMQGKEIVKDGSANIGLLDQRAGLEWVADNIAHFGGDPEKVTIWGESAGSISVFNQLALYKGNHTYKGKPLFRGAIMDSGSIIPANPLDGLKAQEIYNKFVKRAGCSSANDTLSCIRALPYDQFKAASDSFPGLGSYSSVALSFIPRPDGKVLAESTELLVKHNHYAKVPFIVGDQEDEGTNFSRAQRNVTNTKQVVDYFSTVFFPYAPRDRVRELVSTYPNNPAAGSPFRTGKDNNIYPEYKRMAAIIGDITFTLARRVFLSSANAVNPNVPSWSYIGSYKYGTPIVGTAHGTDIPRDYGEIPGFVTSSIQSYFLSFVNTLDPNAQSDGLTHWPQWSANQSLIWFLRHQNDILLDRFRNDSYTFLLDPKKPLRV